MGEKVKNAICKIFKIFKNKCTIIAMKKIKCNRTFNDVCR